MYKRDIEKLAELGAELGSICHTLVIFAMTTQSKYCV